MKTINDKLSNEKAQKELKHFATLGLIFAVVALVIFGFLGIVGLAFSARALILANHVGNKNNPKLKQYRLMAIAGVVISVVGLILLYAVN